MAKHLRQYKIQVPLKIPNDALTDTMGRKWVKSTDAPVDQFMIWDVEDMWFVWFRGNSEVPEEGEIIDFGTAEGVVESVYHHKRVKRAMVILSI